MAYSKKANMNDAQKDMRLMQRDDGCIYTYNKTLIDKPNFNEVKLIGNKYVPVGKKKVSKEDEAETDLTPLAKDIERAKEKQELKKYPSGMNSAELVNYAKKKFDLDIDPELTNNEKRNIIKNFDKKRK